MGWRGTHRRGARPGFTLIEVVVAIAMIAVMAGAIGNSVLAKINEARIARAVREVLAIEQGVASWTDRTGSTNYSSVSIGALTSTGALPSAFAGSTVNPWAGSYGLSGSTTSFTVTVTSVPNATIANAFQGAFGTRATVTPPSSYPGTITIAFSDS